MANLQAGRDTRAKEIFISVDYPVKAATHIYDGALVGLVGGYAAPAVDGAGNYVVGVADFEIDNTAGANGDLHIRVRRGVFHLDTANIVQADCGKPCYPTDDHTVSHTAGANNTLAGEILSLDVEGGVWVKVGP